MPEGSSYADIIASKFSGVSSVMGDSLIFNLQADITLPYDEHPEGCTNNATLTETLTDASKSLTPTQKPSAVSFTPASSPPAPVR
ncbi:hypothetical protein PM082_008769 [Marasmius tenuissimus]|nr:hypothetical protein PM082_008769 [Marasmius tenuissimus]